MKILPIHLIFVILIIFWNDEFVSSLKKKKKSQAGNVKNVKNLEDSNKNKIIKPIVKFINQSKKPKKSKKPVKPVEVVKPKEKLSREEIWKKLSNVKNADDFFRSFQLDKKIQVKKVNLPPVHKKIVGIGKDSESQYGYVFNGIELGSSNTKRFGVSKDEESSSAIVFQEYECTPRPKVVQLPLVIDSAYWPTCMVINQCGGCCTHLSRECVPSRLENASITILKIPYDGSPITPHQHYMLQHASCECKCRVRESNCLESETYNPNNCECQCLREPSVCPKGKQWSNTECGCVCSSQSQTCPERHIWSNEECRCKCESKSCPIGHVRDPSTCYCLSLSNNDGKN